MSKRVKFALITWIGEDVSGLQRAKTGTDKTLVKEVVQVTLVSRFSLLLALPASAGGERGGSAGSRFILLINPLKRRQFLIACLLTKRT